MRGDYEVTPRDRAGDVARNAPVIVRFSPDIDLDELADSLAAELELDQPVTCAGQLVCLLETEGEPRVIEADVRIEADNLVRLSPREPLAGSTEHTVLIVQPGLDIVARDESSFATGPGSDREPPELSYSAEDVQVGVAELPPECGRERGARRVVLELPAASDDGDAQSVELEVVLTRAGGLTEPEVRARGPNDADGSQLSFILSAEEASGPVCLAIRARDALGRRSERAPPVCFNPSTRPVFESACSIGLVPSMNSGGASPWWLVLAASALARIGRRRAIRRAATCPGSGPP